VRHGAQHEVDRRIGREAVGVLEDEPAAAKLRGISSRASTGSNSATNSGSLGGSREMNGTSIVKLLSTRWQVAHDRPLPPNCSRKNRSAPTQTSTLTTPASTRGSAAHAAARPAGAAARAAPAASAACDSAPGSTASSPSSAPGSTASSPSSADAAASSADMAASAADSSPSAADASPGSTGDSESTHATVNGKHRNGTHTNDTLRSEYA
jgi:hypothetical protein